MKDVDVSRKKLTVKLTVIFVKKKDAARRLPKKNTIDVLKKMKIKICGLRDNFDEVLALNPDFVGMIFYPKSPRYAGDCQDERLRRKLTDTKKVGVFVDADYQTIIRTAGEFHLDAVQLHGSESPQLCEFLQQDFVVIKAFSIATTEDLAKLEAYEGVVDYFLFDTKTPGYGGSGQKFDWQILRSAQIKTPFLLSGGISLDDVPTIKSLSISNLVGVDLNSKFETAPAVKDIAKLSEFMNEIM